MQEKLTELEEIAKRLALSGNWEKESIEINKKILEIDSCHSSANTRLAKCLVELNDIDGAIEIYKKVLAFDPTNKIAENQLIRYEAHDELNQMIALEKLEEEKRKKLKERYSKISGSIKSYSSEYDDPVDIDSENELEEMQQLAIHDEMDIPYNWSGEGY